MPNTVREFSYASEEWMPGFFGPIQLAVSPDAVDQRRIGLDRMSFLADHDETKLMGKVVSGRVTNGVAYIRVKLVETQNNRGLHEELEAGLRSGTSPGFIVNEARALKQGDAGFDKNELMQMRVEKWTPHEVSSSAIPRNPTVGMMALSSTSAATTTSTTSAPKKAPRRPRTASRQPLNAGLERESSPPPPRFPPRAETQAEDYVTAMLRHKEEAMTTALDTLTADKAAEGQDATSPLARLITMGVAPATPKLHHKTEDLELVVDGGRGWCRMPLSTAMALPRAHQAAFDTSNVHGAIGEDAGGPIRQIAEDRSVSAILGSVTQLTGMVGDSLPAELTEPNALASWVLEGAAASYPDLSMQDFGDALKPKTARVSTSFSLQVAIQAGARFETAVDAHLRRALRKLIVGGILTGSGIDNQPVGIMSTTGVLAEEYAVADKGKLSTFFDAEALLDGEVDARKRWIMANDLYNLARRTSVQPLPTNSDRRVVDRSFLAGETPANSTSLLPTGTGIYGAWGDLILFTWEQVLVVLDKITLPGEVRVSMLAHVAVHARAGSFSILRPL